MRINKKRANALLGEVWAQFLKKFIPRLKKFYPNKYTIIRDKIDNKKCYIEFDFDVILCSDIYRIIGNIIKKLNTFGILKMFAERLAISTNLDLKLCDTNDLETRTKTIYRLINKYK